jgi:Holliday junction resolvase RusA-like endonuclease
MAVSIVKELTRSEITKHALEELIYGVCPSKSNCYRIGNKGLFKTKALTDYENKFYIQCKSRNRNLDGYFEIDLSVYYPNERSDLDNSLKIIMDCLQKCKVIKNDNKCIKITAQKYLDKVNPRIEFAIKEV